jgi:hypothetical protein
MKKIMIFILMLMSVTLQAQTVRENDIISEINKLRSNPKAYITYVKDFKTMKSHYKSSANWADACDETIHFLENTNTVDTLSFTEYYFNKLDTFSQFKGEHTTLFPKSGSENLLGTSEANITAREVVLNLLIDINVKGKGHRLTLLNPNYKEVAVKTFTYEGDTYFIQIFN